MLASNLTVVACAERFDRSFRGALRAGAGSRSRVALVFSVWLASVPAFGADREVHVACPDLDAERAAEVEARLRANLLTSERAASAFVSCRDAVAAVRVESGGRTAERSVSLRAVPLADALIEAAAEAFAELEASAKAALPPSTAAATTPAAGPSAATPARDQTARKGTAPEPVGPSAPAPRPTARQKRVLEGVPSNHGASSQRASRLVARVVAEFWPRSLVAGASVGLEQGVGSFWYGLHASGLAPLDQEEQFAVSEWRAAGEAGLAPPFALGLRAAGKLGASLMLVHPDSNVAARGGGSLAVFYAAVEVSRPVWFGRVALLPGAGLEVFSRTRRVNVDGVERLALGTLTLQASLGVAYRTSD